MWAQPPYGWPPPPPPPPPPRPNKPQHHPVTQESERQEVKNSSRRVSSHDGGDSWGVSSIGPQEVVEPVFEPLTVPASLGSEIADVIHRLESKLMWEVQRVEVESQSGQRALAADMAKARKEREAAWRHVSELKEQNRLLRQRNYELEVQSGHLHRHIMLLQEQLETARQFTGGYDVVKGMQADRGILGATLPGNIAAGPGVPGSGNAGPGLNNTVASAAVMLGGGAASLLAGLPANTTGPALMSALLGDKKVVPRLPHSGADIW